MMKTTSATINQIKFTVFYNTKTKQYVGLTVFSDKTKQGKAKVDKYLRSLATATEQLDKILDELKATKQQLDDNTQKIRNEIGIKNEEAGKAESGDPMGG